MALSTYSSKTLYSSLAAEFEGFFEWSREEICAVRKHIHPSALVLDFGCGWGRALRELSPLCRVIVGLDNDAAEIKQAQGSLSGFGNVVLLTCEGSATPFPEESFDVVLMLGNTIGNQDHKTDAVLKEAVRLVKARGKVIISTYSKHTTSEREEAYRKVGMHIMEVKDGKIVMENNYVSAGYTEEELKELLVSHKMAAEIIRIPPLGLCAIATK